MKQVTSSIYNEAIVKILNSLNKFLQDILELTPASILTTLFCTLATFILESPQKKYPWAKDGLKFCEINVSHNVWA